MSSAISDVKLYYFNVRARAELLRLIMSDASIPFQDIRFTSDEWQKQYKGVSPLGQAPWIEFKSADGKQHSLAQTGAIVRFLAKVANLYGSNPWEAARCDMIHEAILDIVQKIYPIFRAQTPDEKEAKTKTFANEELPPWVNALEKQLSSNNDGKGFFVGDNLTFADLAAYNMFSFLASMVPGWATNAPKLAALVERVGARPRIAAWVKSRPVNPY